MQDVISFPARLPRLRCDKLPVLLRREHDAPTARASRATHPLLKSRINNNMQYISVLHVNRAYVNDNKRQYPQMTNADFVTLQRN